MVLFYQFSELQVVDIGDGDPFQSATFAASLADDAGTKLRIIGSWTRARASSTRDYVLIQQRQPGRDGPDLIKEDMFRVSANSGQNFADLTVNNVMTSPGTYQLDFNLDDDDRVNEVRLRRTVTVTEGGPAPTVGSVTLAADDPHITSSTDPVLFTVTVKSTTGALMAGVTATYSIDGAAPDGQFPATNALGQAQVTLTFSDTQNHQIFASAGGKNSNAITITHNLPGGGGTSSISPWLIGGAIVLAALAYRRR